MRFNFSAMIIVGITLSIFGCSDSQPTAESPTSDATPAAAANPYLTTIEPADAMPVGAARQNLTDGESATLIGIIGGSTKPFVDGLAAFTIVDPKVPYCAPEEGCPTPWDYCCTQDQVKDNIATIKMVDESGAPVATDARQLLGISELSQVIVSGTTQRDEQGNLTLAANTIFVKP